MNLLRSMILFRLLLALLCLGLVGACDAGPKIAGKGKGELIPVSIHGVNYGDHEMSYLVQDPADKKNSGGGELIGPFSAGGTMCCYNLPKTWRPGLQIEVNATIYVPPPKEEPNGAIKEIALKNVVEVPKYEAPGELWVLRNVDDSFAVFSSDYQPDHEKWPGAVKGWPKPSVEYMRARWDLEIKLAQESVNRDKKALAELETNPEPIAKELWDYKQEEIKEFADRDPRYGDRIRWAREDKALLAKFSGHHDPKFIESLKKDYAKLLTASEAKLKHLQDTRP